MKYPYAIVHVVSLWLGFNDKIELVTELIKL